MENDQNGMGSPAQISVHKLESFNSSLQQGCVNFPQVSWNGTCEAATRGLGAEWGWYRECINAHNLDDVSMWRTDGGVLIAYQ